ncbi:hypothetical protein ABD91_20615 [Lysinibacillus sphaericus]|uniref:PcfJ domain-containing protein n=1 Tax=Lysinibacillus sphaericus TaxID=1421 RepID=UPI0018CFE45E|nr:PcfJ domain-containing protein [Lysinibacillus sphaericus]MBG9693147.1 hypothetical protein [Lysinibacillus sphaericus]
MKFKGDMKKMNLMVVDRDERNYSTIMEFDGENDVMVSKEEKRRLKQTKVYCLKCQTYFKVKPALTPLPVQHFYINNREHQFDQDRHITCPSCGNTNAIEMEAMHWNAAYLVDTEEKFTYKLYGQSFYLTANASEVLYKDADNFIILQNEMEFLNSDEFQVDKNELTVRQMMNKYASNYKSPVRVKVSKKYLMNYVRKGEGAKVAVTPNNQQTMGIFIDKATKLTKIRTGSVINTINLNRMSYSAEYAFLAILKTIPFFVAKQMYEIYISDIHPNVLTKWELGELSNKRDEMIEQLKKAMLISYLPNIQFLERAIDFSKYTLDKYTMKKFKAAEKEIDIIRSFVPAISKKSARFLKEAMGIERYVQEANSTFLFALMQDKNALNQLLEHYVENHAGVMIKTEVEMSIEFLNSDILTFRQVQKMLNRHLAPGSIDNAVFEIMKIYREEYANSDKSYERNYVFREIGRLRSFVVDAVRGLKQYSSLKAAYLECVKAGEYDADTIAFKDAIIEEFERTTFYSVRKLHDKINRVNRKISSTYKEYNIPDTWLIDELIKAGYHIRYIRNTEELFTIAEDLNLCVDQYEEPIVKHQVKILGVYKRNEPVLCIELGIDGVVRQVKKHSNEFLAYGNTPEEDHLVELVKEWIMSNGYKINSPDLEQVGLKSNVKKAG